MSKPEGVPCRYIKTKEFTVNNFSNFITIIYSLLHSLNFCAIKISKKKRKTPFSFHLNVTEQKFVS